MEKAGYTEKVECTGQAAYMEKAGYTDRIVCEIGTARAIHEFHNHFLGCKKC
jgi:hypothetical protein